MKKTLDLNKSSQNELFTNYLSFMFSWWYLFFSLSVLKYCFCYNAYGCSTSSGRLAFIFGDVRVHLQCLNLNTTQ